MEDSLNALAEAVRTRGAGPVWHRRVEGLAWEVGELLRGAVAAKTGDGHSSPDILVEGAADGVPLAVQIAVWRRSRLDGAAVGFTAQTAQLMRDADRIRRDFPGGVRLCLLIAVVGAPDGEDPATRPELAEVTAGYDRVVLGTVDRDDTWRRLRFGAAPQPVADFHAAVRGLAEIEDGTPEEAVPVPAPSTHPLRVLLVAGEWGSGLGGLSTVNRELAVALAAAGAEVHVALPAFTGDELVLAAKANVHLVAPEPIPGIEGAPLLLAKPAFADPDYYPDVIVGHGRHLGPYALGLQRHHFPKAKRVHLVHTDAERLEEAKEEDDGPSRMLLAGQRTAIEVDLAVSATLAAGVGPLLAEAIEERMRGRGDRTAFPLLPGLRDWGRTVNPQDPPKTRRVLLIARAEDLRSKGIDIGVRAVREATERLGQSIDRRPVLIIRGVPPEAPEKLKRAIKELAEPVLEVAYRAYSADERQLRADLWGARVVIMPSRHEAFGLAAYEAIAAGVPVLITQESGLAQMMTSMLDDEERPWPREIIPVRGADEAVQKNWADALERILTNPRQAFLRAAELREQIQSRVTWATSVAGLLTELGHPPGQ